MLYCSESDCLLFLASPLVDGLEALTSRGLYISDIPIHDATRDIVLVGEQSRAQVCSYSLSVSNLFNLVYRIGVIYLSASSSYLDPSQSKSLLLLLLLAAAAAAEIQLNCQQRVRPSVRSLLFFYNKRPTDRQTDKERQADITESRALDHSITSRLGLLVSCSLLRRRRWRRGHRLYHSYPYPNLVNSIKTTNAVLNK